MSQATTEKPIDSYEKFEKALMNIHANPVDNPNPFITVNDSLFQALANGRTTSYLTYGNPGVKVYKSGTKEDIDREEGLSLEQFHALEIKRKRGEIK